MYSGETIQQPSKDRHAYFPAPGSSIDPVADGAYDYRSVYDRASAVGTESIVIVIPLIALRCRRGSPTAHGRSGKRLFRGFSRSGDGQARHSKAQRREAAMGCPSIKWMAELGRPKSYVVVS